jgi:hypothetical protein
MTVRRTLPLAFLLATIAPGCGVVDKITDPPGLSIRSFAATPAEIGAGGSAVLDWSIEGAESSDIDNGVGAVQLRGTRTVRPERTTVYTLTARAGTSTSTATARVTVTGSIPLPTPTPVPVVVTTPTPAAPTPTATPGASATATPTPASGATATPTAAPAATATPTPAGTALPATCGSSASAAGNCTVTISKPTALASGQCIELNLVTVNQDCPVGVNTVRSVRFDVSAHTTRTGLVWRRADGNSDVLSPGTGAISSNGTTSVLLTDTVLQNTVTFEIVDGGTVLLSFTLRHF